MFLAHSFRLRDPWQCERQTEVVRWTRVFHRPTGLEPDDALWLVVAGLPPGSSVELNATPLSPHADRPGQFEVTRFVTETNQIALVIPNDSAQRPVNAKFPFDVRLGVVGTSD